MELRALSTSPAGRELTSLSSLCTMRLRSRGIRQVNETLCIVHLPRQPRAHVAQLTLRHAIAQAGSRRNRDLEKVTRTKDNGNRLFGMTLIKHKLARIQ